MMQTEQDELVAAVADEDVAAVDLCVHGVSDLLEDVVAAEMAACVIDLLEVIHVKDGEGEGEAARICEHRELCNAVGKLVAVERTRKKVAYGLVL